MAKVLIAGASGGIGSAALEQCWKHPDVATVVAFVRRELPADVSSNPKLQTVIVKDLLCWPDELIEPHKDAKAMIWSVGDNLVGDPVVNIDAPLAFQKAFIELRSRIPANERNDFRYVHISGKFVIQDQDANLRWGDHARKVKGRHDTQSIELAEKHKPSWRTFILRPGGVILEKWYGGKILEMTTGKNWFVRASELGAYMVYLALGGSENDTIVPNSRIVEKGREMLKSLA